MVVSLKCVEKVPFALVDGKEVFRTLGSPFLRYSTLPSQVSLH